MLLPAVFPWASIAVQVFGGCCSNVYTLESILTIDETIGILKSMGTLLTFTQFLGVSLFTIHEHINFSKSSWRRLYFNNPKIPLRYWFILVCMYFTVLVLNNCVLSFNISMPMFIVFRLTGTVVTMAVGYLFAGKRYNMIQIFSCFLISLGAIVNSLPSNIGYPILKLSNMDADFIIGISIMIITSIISAFMGLFNERLYAKYGNQWKESLFYTHVLALPLFVFVWPSLKEAAEDLLRDTSTYPLFPSILSRQIVNLFMNVITQYVCIRGVNYLVGATLALTVSVVLLLRKFVSLIISVILFDNEFTNNNVWGTFLVMSGALLYSNSNRRKLRDSEEKKKR